MSYSIKLSHTLLPYEDDLVKVFQLRFTLNGSLEVFSESITNQISDGVNTAESFGSLISKDRKELFFYYTLDAFTGFSTTSKVEVRRKRELLLTEEGFNVQTFDQLNSYDALNSHLQGNNAWLIGLEV